uniref:UBA domain-containing protein n=1 Tax=Globisporangium ultimum (strain ATCC 200006 / CBS 805.95 / DAOM BR144) TaxID=431595 RepID=K3XAZ0_GLOUD
MRLRVLSVRDSREWLVPLHDDHQRQVQVADLKRLALRQQQHVDRGAMHQRRKAPSDERKSEDDDDDDAGGSDAFVMFRGRILADMDFVNLHSLTASDFFVLAHDNAGDEVHSMIENRDVASSAVDNEAKVQQLVDMGFPVDRVWHVMQRAAFDTARSIAILTGDEVIEASFVSNGASTDEASELLVRAHPQLQVLQPVLGELQKLGVDQIAARDSLQAILLLKQHVPNESLAQLNANPAAALQFFRLPPSRREQHSGARTEDEMQMRKRKRQEHEPTQESASELIDLVDDPPAATEQQPHGDDDQSGERATEDVDGDAIARLASMGFDRELATAMYESCGRHEESALNALCSLLD